MSGQTQKTDGLKADHFVAAALLAASGVIAYDTFHLRLPATDAGLGARAFPYAVALVLAVLSVATVLNCRNSPAPNDGVPDRKPLALMVFGLVLQIVCLPYLGFTVATGLMFFCAAWAFGARPLLLVLPVGLVLAFLAYLLFRHGLQLNLPMGFVERLV